MKRCRALMGWSFLVVFIISSAAALRAGLHLRFPADIEPDFYQSGGPIGSLQDGEWVAIPFWRPPDLIPDDFNLLDTFDPGAIGLPLLVEGFLRLRESGPPAWEARGLGELPFWFVSVSDFEAAAADGELTIVELSALASLVTGTADFYQEQNHIFGIQPGESLHARRVGHARRRPSVRRAIRRKRPELPANAHWIRELRHPDWATPVAGLNLRPGHFSGLEQPFA